MYIRKCRGPRTEPCGTKCLTVAQSETLLLFSLSFCKGGHTLGRGAVQWEGGEN
jgi:hypothetical protein